MHSRRVANDNADAEDGCAPSIADRRAASASRSLTTRRPKPPCHNGTAICAAASAATPEGVKDWGLGVVTPNLS
jgi:hypothetical protein